ncbi:MAG: GNAT family N-acetyltransferase [Prolixibacteraceae bacterium]
MFGFELSNIAYYGNVCSMEIRVINDKTYKDYLYGLTSLYIETFSSGKSFQYYNAEETENYIKLIFEVGYGIIALDNSVLVGAILLTPFSFDNLHPKEISQQFDIKSSIYVAEMMVEKTKQGQGIGKKLLRYFFDTVDKRTFTDAFIRVWIENEAAVGLYEKMGFAVCASTVQHKLLADKSKIVNFEKIYLHQKLI